VPQAKQQEFLSYDRIRTIYKELYLTDLSKELNSTSDALKDQKNFTSNLAYTIKQLKIKLEKANKLISQYRRMASEVQKKSDPQPPMKLTQISSVGTISSMSQASVDSPRTRNSASHEGSATPTNKVIQTPKPKMESLFSKMSKVNYDLQCDIGRL
jgi:uncharacterized protein YoxC